MATWEVTTKHIAAGWHDWEIFLLNTTYTCLLYDAINLKLQFRVADPLDKLLMVVGVLAAVLHGAAMPVAISILSEGIDRFVNDSVSRKHTM